MQNNSESQIEIDQQFELPDKIDLSVYTKKRDQKLKQDDIVDGDQEGTNRDSTLSAKRLLKSPSKLRVSKEVSVVSKLNTLKQQDSDAKPRWNPN